MYRTLRDIRVPLGALNVVTGANGSGKSSLYRALKLLADIAQGRIIQSLAAEGGLQSTLWAGAEAFSRAMKAGTQSVQGLVRKNPISLKLGFQETITAMPSISACRGRTRVRNSRATRKSRSKANGPVNGSDGPTH
jgi:predicted ATPase